MQKKIILITGTSGALGSELKKKFPNAITPNHNELDIISRENLMIVIIISMILLSSLIFYEQLKIDYEHEKESFEIMNNIYPMIGGINSLSNESYYLKTIQTIEERPERFTEMGLGKYKNITISPENFESIENFIIESRGLGLTHIIIDEKEDRVNFLQNLFKNEENYTYLERIYDSKLDGFTYHLKVFKIDYEKFDSIVNKESRN